MRQQQQTNQPQPGPQVYQEQQLIRQVLQRLQSARQKLQAVVQQSYVTILSMSVLRLTRKLIASA